MNYVVLWGKSATLSLFQPMRFEADMYYIIEVANTELHHLAIQVVTGADDLSG